MFTFLIEKHFIEIFRTLWDIRFLTYISGENDFSEPNWSDYLENAAFRHTKEMVRIFQVVNLSILDTNLSFIELQNFLVNAELLYYIEIIQKIILKFYIFLQIFYLYHLRKNFKYYLNKCRL